MATKPGTAHPGAVECLIAKTGPVGPFRVLSDAKLRPSAENGDSSRFRTLPGLLWSVSSASCSWPTGFQVVADLVEPATASCGGAGFAW
jgi:hypothetical protein